MKVNNGKEFLIKNTEEIHEKYWDEIKA
jgi:hypothetical protein